MATEITMPKLSDTMTEGRFGSWRKSVGDQVARGEIIAEVETDKAVMELEAYATGILLEQRAATGDLIAVGTVIGLIGKPGETSTPAVAPAAEPAQPQTMPSGSGPAQIIDGEQPVMPAQPHAAQQHADQAAPVVRRRARELGIDLPLVSGSGPGGRILLEDLERFSGVSIDHAEMPGQIGVPDLVVAPRKVPFLSENADLSPIPQVSSPTAEKIPLSRMRAAIARTVSEAWRTIPHFYLSVDVTMDAAAEVMRELRLGGGSISLNDLVIKASAMALARYPQVNGSFAGDSIILEREINIGIAVALPDGLLVPVLKGADGLTLKEIAVSTPALVARARNGQLAATELLGGTFAITNLGMYGVATFAAIIHPGQLAILAVGAMRESVVAKAGVPVIAKVMTLTLSADHRGIDGATAAEFMSELKAILETPVRMLV